MREINIPLQKVNKLLRIVSNESKNSEKKINNKEFALISKWYFFAILDLFLLDNFVNDKVWMAKKVGLKMTEFNAAFQTLVDNGHIDEVDGEFRVISQSTAWVNTKKTTRDRQNYQKQILEKAKEAVDTESFDRRENASLTLAANSNIIPEIKKKIQIFKDELREFIEEQGEYDEVYQLSVNFFPLTKVIN